MSRSVGSLSTHLAGRGHTRCTLLRLDLSDGTSIGITDHDLDITTDLVGASLTYSASTGILPSDVALSTGLDADNYEISGPIDDTVTLEALLGGRFDRARVRLFQVNWKSLASGYIPIMAGNVSEVRVEGGKFIFEIRSDSDRFNQTIGRILTPYCDADHGDARCGRVAETVVGTVTAATDAMRFTVSFAGSYADDYFNKGTVEFLTGDLAGTRPVEIEDWTSVGAITLFTFLSDTPAIGDTMTIKRGCGQTRPECMARNNILNFRGFPEVPGSDQVLKISVPETSE